MTVNSLFYLLLFMVQVMGKTRGLMDFRTDILVRVPDFLEQIESTLCGISTEQLKGWVKLAGPKIALLARFLPIVSSTGQFFTLF